MIAPVMLVALTTMSVTVSDWTVTTRVAALGRAERALQNYLDPEKVAVLQAVVEKNRQDLLQISDPKQFAKVLTSDLQAAVHDKHIIVWFSEDGSTNQAHGFTAKQIAEQNRFFRYVDFGYSASARLPGNVGYLRLGGFANLPGAKDTIDAAMLLLCSTQSLIVDLRGNGGGDSDTVNYLLAYFFARPTEVTGARQRVAGKDVFIRNFTPAKVGSPRYLEKPVFILIDKDTISGGEMFAYDMKSLHRASIVGERSAGAANGLGSPPYYLSDHLSISVPDTLLRNPYTGTNWEDVGVAPDVPTNGEAALLAAYKRGLETANQTYDPLGEIAQARKDPAATLRAFVPVL